MGYVYDIIIDNKTIRLLFSSNNSISLNILERGEKC